MVGVGLLNKWSLLFFVAGLGVALVVTPLRSHLRGWPPWAGAGLAVAINLPCLVWQVRHDWPTLEFMANATRFKNAPLTLGAFAWGQVLELGPVSAPVWLAGLALLFGPQQVRARPLAVIYVVAFAVIALQGGKASYLKPASLRSWRRAR